MVQIEHMYHFLYDNLFPDFRVCHPIGGVPSTNEKITPSDISVYHGGEVFNVTDGRYAYSMFFYDQEPLWTGMVDKYYDYFTRFLEAPSRIWKPFLVTSEKSDQATDLYYFFHGFAALDWFRGYHAMNHHKPVVRACRDYITFNRTITGDRAYRRTFVELLRSRDLLHQGLVSYGVDGMHEDYLAVDGDRISADASASIPLTIKDHSGHLPDYDAFWHVVTETVFDQPKLHLTEKIFKPIVSKQPFMLLAAPGNLEYLRSYGFRTFNGIIDESYDTMPEGQDRINAVVSQLEWYCALTDKEKTRVQQECESMVEHNFQHFYGQFREIIADELLHNTKEFFDRIGHDDSRIDYATIRSLLI